MNEVEFFQAFFFNVTFVNGLGGRDVCLKFLQFGFCGITATAVLLFLFLNTKILMVPTMMTLLYLRQLCNTPYAKKGVNR